MDRVTRVEVRILAARGRPTSASSRPPPLTGAARARTTRARPMRPRGAAGSHRLSPKMIHLRLPGPESCSPLLIALANKIHGIDHDPRRHTGADPVLVIRRLLESHADREALYDPDEVAGGVVRGKQGKHRAGTAGNALDPTGKGPFGDAVDADLARCPTRMRAICSSRKLATTQTLSRSSGTMLKKGLRLQSLAELDRSAADDPRYRRG